MSLHDYNLANQTPASYRTDGNNLFSAIATNNYSSSGRTNTFQNGWEADGSSDGWMRLRNTADSTSHYMFRLDKAGGLTTYGGNPSTNVEGKYQGQPVYDTANDKMYFCTLAGTSSQATWTQFQSGDPTGVAPTGFYGGQPYKYTSASTITIPGGTIARDDSDSADISLSTDHTIDLTVTGVGGLSTDLTEASTTRYWGFLIRKSGDGTVNVIATDSSSGPLMPSGYDQKRRMPGSIFNSTSSNITPFKIVGGWPWTPTNRYLVSMTLYSSSGAITKGETNVLSTGTATSFTDVDMQKFVPPDATSVKLHTSMNIGGAAFELKNKDTTAEVIPISYGQSASSLNHPRTEQVDIDTDSSQTIQYRRVAAGNDLYLDVREYTSYYTG